ncbi:unnamed protein product, partial [Polarella glacialis]
ARLREDARERLRLKFGGSAGMGSMGSSPQPAANDGYDIGGYAGGAVGFAGGMLGGAVGFLKSNVLENEQLRSTLSGTVGSVGQLAGGMLGSIRQSAADGETWSSLKRNATFEEGSALRGNVGWAASTVGGAWTNARSGIGEAFGDGDTGCNGAPQAPRCSQGHSLR